MSTTELFDELERRAAQAAAIAGRFRAAAKLRVEIVAAPAGSLPADTPPLVDSRRWDGS